jgi:four helix bundle protein
LRRAGISTVINIAEGSGKFTKADKRNFYTIARGSVYECVALIDILFDEDKISEEIFRRFYGRFESISKMLSGLIKSLS